VTINPYDNVEEKFVVVTHILWCTLKPVLCTIDCFWGNHCRSIWASHRPTCGHILLDRYKPNFCPHGTLWSHRMDFHGIWYDFSKICREN